MSFVGSRRALLTRKTSGGFITSDPDVAAWAAVVGAGTNQAEVTALTTFVVADKADGNWAKRDRLWIYMLGTAGAAAIDLVARASHSLVSSPTFTTLGGYTGNGTSSYINTGFNPSTMAVKGTRNDTSHGVDIAVAESRGSGAFYAFNGNNSATNTNGIFRNSNNTQWAWGANNTLTSDNTNFSGGVQSGLIVAERTGSAAGASAIYGAGASLGVGATGSNALISANFFVLSINNGGGVAGFWTNARLRGFWYGASLGATGQANFATRWGTLKTALGAS